MDQYKYKLKDKKAQIYKRVPQKTSKGVILDYWRQFDISPVWCYSQILSSSIENSEKSIENKEDRLFVFNFIPNLEKADAIKYKNQWYKITRVSSFDDYNGEIFAYSALIHSQDDKFISKRAV